MADLNHNHYGYSVSDHTIAPEPVKQLSRIWKNKTLASAENSNTTHNETTYNKAVHKINSISCGVTVPLRDDGKFADTICAVEKFSYGFPKSLVKLQHIGHCHVQNISDLRHGARPWKGGWKLSVFITVNWLSGPVSLRLKMS